MRFSAGENETPSAVMRCYVSSPGKRVVERARKDRQPDCSLPLRFAALRLAAAYRTSIFFALQREELVEERPFRAA